VAPQDTDNLSVNADLADRIVLGVCSAPSQAERRTLMIPFSKSTSSILRPHNSPERIPVPAAVAKNAFI
jgi:hypothetical protein